MYSPRMKLVINKSSDTAEITALFCTSWKSGNRHLEKWRTKFK